MLNPEHWKWFKRLFRIGSNTDVDPNELANGAYTDSFNMRPSGTDGNTGAIKRIGGESLLYPATEPGAASYICIGACSVNGRLVEFWANSLPGFDPLIRIDGVVSAQSPNIPYRYDRPLQMAVVEDCKGGVVYPADHASDPLFWDIQDLIQNNPDNDNTQLYFSAYTPEINSVGPQADTLVPWLDKIEPLVNLVGPVGLLPGQVAYSARWRTPQGDYTEWGPETPLITIPGAYQPAFAVTGSPYPGARTNGWEPSLIKTAYAPKIRLRINNRFGFASVEIKRRSYTDGAGLTGAGVEEIIARLTLLPEELSIRTFIDPPDANLDPPEVVPPPEADDPQLLVRKPKTVEYADRRLSYGNFQVDPQPSEITWRQVGGRTATSITKKVVRRVGFEEVPIGYSDPYNATYFKSAVRGERHGYAFQGFGFNQSRFYAINDPLLTDYQHPNRQDIKGPNGQWGQDSLDYSDDPCWSANVDLAGTTPEGPVGATFEATTQGSRSKTDLFSPINVQAPSSDITPGTGVSRPLSLFNLYSFGIPPGFVPQFDPGSLQVVVRPDTGGYQPWTPVNNQDGRNSYAVPPNVARLTGPAASNAFAQQCFPFNPDDSLGKVFAPTYHALGTLIYGVQNIPSSIKAFTIARTAPAGRVIMQGMGSYVLVENVNAPANKSTNSLYIHFPDLEAGIVDQATIDDMTQNPQNYRAQVVAGRGFFNETYAYSGEQFGPLDAPWCGPCVGAHIIDMITYARIQRDTGQVNVGEPPAGGMGYQPIIGSPAPNDNYIGIDKWRRNGPMTGQSFWQDPGNDGNTLLDIASFTPITDGRSSFYRITFDQYIYPPSSDTVGFSTAFNDAAVRDFHTPFLVVNILRVNASVPAANSTPLVNTGCTVVMSTTIGVYAGGVQDFELLGERERYDCAGYLPTDFRYAYVLQPDGQELRYLCITGNAVINTAQVVSDILTLGSWTAPDGLPVYGVYELVQDANGTDYLRFGILGTTTVSGSRVVVKYDPTAPLRVFGHDATIGPSIHAVLDRQATRDALGGSFKLNGLPLPYAGFFMNPRYFMPEKGNQTEEQIAINYLVSLRQWCVLWDAESRAAPAMFLNLNSSPGNRLDEAQFFPTSPYRIRPSKDLTGGTGASNGFFGQYDVDFPDEYLIFPYGGLRFRPAFNLDYAKQPDPEFFSLPKAGFTERTDYCNGIIASNVFAPTQQDLPGLRTFRASNLHLISPETGEVKMIASLSDSATGQNMYFWTQRGWGYVLTNKNVLSDASGQVIATQVADSYWGQSVFKSRDIGMPDQLWRVAVKGAASASNTVADTIFWCDRQGVYRLVGGNFYPIAEDKMLRAVLPALAGIGDAYAERVTGAFDRTKQEYLLCVIPNPPVLPPPPPGTFERLPRRPFVYSTKRDQWQGSYGHMFDRLVVSGGSLRGMRAEQSWTVDSVGDIQNGAIMQAYAEAPFVPEPGVRYEAVEFRVHPSKPDRIEVYNASHDLIFYTDQATQEALSPGSGALWIKRIDGWQNLMGRSNPDLDPDRKRLQDELFFLRVIFASPGQHVLVDSQLRLKRLV